MEQHLKGYYLYVDDDGAYPFFVDEAADGGDPYWMYGFEPEDAFGRWHKIYPLPQWPLKAVREYDPPAEDEEPEDDWGY